MAHTRTLFAAFALALALVPACDDDNGVFVDDPVGDTIDQGNQRGDVLAGEAHDELTQSDFDVLIGKTATILAALNDGEIDQAQFAINVVIEDDVFDLANVIISDHQAANAALDEVIRSYGVPFLPSTTADTLAAEANAGLAQLRTTPPTQVDFTYVQLQVIQHAEAQVLLDELAAQVGPGAMGDYIANTQDMIDEHLAISTDLLQTFF
jgi:predicted outer membrane protein